MNYGIRSAINLSLRMNYGIRSAINHWQQKSDLARTWEMVL